MLNFEAKTAYRAPQLVLDPVVTRPQFNLLFDLQQGNVKLDLPLSSMTKVVTRTTSTALRAPSLPLLTLLRCIVPVVDVMIAGTRAGLSSYVLIYL